MAVLGRARRDLRYCIWVAGCINFAQLGWVKVSASAIMDDMEPTTEKERLARLGELIKSRRLELDMSKRAVSTAAGLSINTYHRVEEGAAVRDVSYAKIENILGWAAGSVQEILDGAPAPVVVERSAMRGVVHAKVPEADLEGAVTSAFVAVSDTMTAAEIRDLSRRVLDELKRRGIVEGE